MKKKKLEIELRDLQLEPICDPMEMLEAPSEDHGNSMGGSGIPNFVFDAIIGPCS